MTQFICECCKKIFDLDKAVILNAGGVPYYICEECDKASRTTMSFVECAWCGEYVDESELKAVFDDDEGRNVKICKQCAYDLMVPLENTCVCCGEVIPEGLQVCPTCLDKAVQPIPELKIDWGARELKESGIGDAIARGFAEGIKEKEPTVDIHKIIDDAMEKRDRTVSIFISAENNAVSVNVYPVNHDEVYWKADPDGLICTNCGFQDQSYCKHTYCPGCGELMHGIR